eukprot:6214049-Pleurochrysis_carterae.AAC.1
MHTNADTSFTYTIPTRSLTSLRRYPCALTNVPGCQFGQQRVICRLPGTRRWRRRWWTASPPSSLRRRCRCGKARENGQRAWRENERRIWREKGGGLGAKPLRRSCVQIGARVREKSVWRDGRECTAAKDDGNAR